jgi:hypothetical protein
MILVVTLAKDREDSALLDEVALLDLALFVADLDARELANVAPDLEREIDPCPWLYVSGILRSRDARALFHNPYADGCGGLARRWRIYFTAARSEE